MHWGLRKLILLTGNPREALLRVVSVGVVTFRSLGRSWGYGVVNYARMLAILGGADLGRERLSNELVGKLIERLGLGVLSQGGGQHLARLGLRADLSAGEEREPLRKDLPVALA